MTLLRLKDKYKLILGSDRWKKTPVLVVLMTIAGLFEMLSISLVLPFMDIVIRPEAAMKNSYIGRFCTIFQIESAQAMLIYIGIILALIYVIKNAYLVWEVYFQQGYVYGSMYEVRSKLFEAILQKPYDYFIGIESGQILTYMNSHIINVFNLLERLLGMLGEMMVVSMLIIALLIISPKISLLMGMVILLLMLLISRGIKPLLEQASKDNQYASKEMFKWVIQSIQGIKEVKISAAEDFFLNNHNVNGKIYSKTTCKYNVLNNTPRLLIETVVMSSFFTAVVLFIAVGNNLSNMIPVVTTIAMAVIRLLPAANRISTALASIAYSEPYLDDLLFFIRDLDKTPRDMGESNKVIDFTKGIKMEDIVYRYPNTNELVLNHASLSIEKGETIGIVGVSGAGKTTAMDVLIGLLKPENGSVYVDGIDIKQNYRGWISKIGYIPQSIFMLDDSIRRNVAFSVSDDKIDENDIWEALDEAAIGEFVRGLPQGIETRIGERGVRLSGGQRQRIGIARALYRNPDVLFFDEATSALDNDTESMIMESMKLLKGKKTMVIIAHRLSTIEGCDRVYKVEGGKIVPYDSSL